MKTALFINAYYRKVPSGWNEGSGTVHKIRAAIQVKNFKLPHYQCVNIILYWPYEIRI